MKTNAITKLALTAAVAAAMFQGGCGYFYKKGPEAPPPAQEDTSPAKYEGASAGPGLTPAESSLVLSERYAVLAVEAEKLRSENKRLTDDNVNLSSKLAKLEADSDQTAKELKEANAMLIDMRIELNNWKNNVLGFRDEMRESQKAQLEALLKIMQLLGGETHGQPGGESATEPGSDPNQAK
jgi:hypothetical protein